MIPKYFLPIWSLPPSHKSVKGEDWHSSTTSALSAGAWDGSCLCSAWSKPHCYLTIWKHYHSKCGEMICYKEWQVVFSNEGCKVDFSCSDVFLYIPLETGSSDGRLAIQQAKSCCFFDPMWCLTSWTLPLATEKSIWQTLQQTNEAPLLLENTLYRFHSGCHLLNLLPV